MSLDYFDKAPFKFNGTIEQVRVQYVAPKKEPIAETPKLAAATRG